MSQPPGHYPAEGDPPDTVRYWDGEQWVGDPIPAPPSAGAVPAVSGLAGGEPVSKMDRFICVLLEAVLAVVTLGIGWMIWALILVLRNEGQTPAKKIMNQKVMIEETGMPAGAAGRPWRDDADVARFRATRSSVIGEKSSETTPPL